MGRVQGKVAIVTGAAQGIGRATADLLAREGAITYFTDVDSENGMAAVAAATAAGQRAHFIAHDVSSQAHWGRVMEQVLAAEGRLDILVNNAGLGTYNDVESLTLEQWRGIMSINLDGTFMGTQAAIATMKQTGGGAIVNVSSVAAFVGTPSLAAYSASKAGVHIFTKCAAVHCGQHGYNIRINSVHPGLVDTRAGIEMASKATGQSPEQARAMFASLHPIGRIGQPEEIAYAILHLASDEASFTTGSAYVVDGAFTCL